MDDLDAVWNRAGEYGARGDVPDGTPNGFAALSYLLRFYNSTMGGGLGFAFEVNEEFRVRRAIDAARYLGLADVAAFWQNLLDHFPDYEYIESRYLQYDELMGNGDVIEEAFRSRFAVAPDDFVAPPSA